MAPGILQSENSPYFDVTDDEDDPAEWWEYLGETEDSVVCPGCITPEEATRIVEEDMDDLGIPFEPLPPDAHSGPPAGKW